jgi:hypothetical protein
VTDQISAALDAVLHGDGTRHAATAGALADDVIVETNFGRAEGAEAAAALLSDPRVAGVVSGVRWSAPETDGGRVLMTGTPAGPSSFGLEAVAWGDGGRITRLELQIQQPAPPEPTALRLTGQIKNAVNGALDNHTPVLIAYTDDTGQVHLSYRGTVQPHGEHGLALWAREPDGGLPRNITARPQVTLFYHDPASRTTYSFYGRARIEHDPAARTRIFEGSHPRERQMDFRRHGVAIVVDLGKIEGRDPGGRFLMVAG